MQRFKHSKNNLELEIANEILQLSDALEMHFINNQNELPNVIEFYLIPSLEFYRARLKLLFSYYRLLQNGDHEFLERENSRDSIERCSIFRKIKIVSEILPLSIHDSVEIIEDFIDEKTDLEIFNFIPLLGKNGKKIGGGVVDEDHSFGRHFHYCTGKDYDDHKRTNLMFTNHYDFSSSPNVHLGLYYGDHGSGLKFNVSTINKKSKNSIIEINKKLINRFDSKSWVKLPDKFSKFI